jgi:hypothetical protein
MLKTYYLISHDLKIVLTTLHKGEGGGARTVVTGGRGPINCLSQQFLHAIVGFQLIAILKQDRFIYEGGGGTRLKGLNQLINQATLLDAICPL